MATYPGRGASSAHPDTPLPETAKNREETNLPSCRRSRVQFIRALMQEIATDNATLVAAGVTFYLLLALTPALAAAISLYGLVADPNQIQDQLTAVGSILPNEVRTTIEGEMTRISATSRAAGWGAFVGLLFAIWSASRGMAAVLQSMNIIYGIKENRGFFRLSALAITMMIGAAVLVAVAVTAIVAVPVILRYVGLSSGAEIAVNWGRWLLLVAMAYFGVLVLYRVGPNRRGGHWRWFSPGAVLATVLWLIASFLFSLYVEHFGNYNKTYGSLGAVVVLLMWLYISTFVLLLGGELDSLLERGRPKCGDNPEPDAAVTQKLSRDAEPRRELIE